MKINKKLMAAMLIGAFLLTLALAGLAYADTGTATASNCQISIQDANGTPKLTFNLGDPIHIKWLADGSVNIEVKCLSTGKTYDHYGPYTDSNTWNDWIFSPTDAGRYKVYVNGNEESEIISVGSFFVVPESVFGALAAVGAGFAAFGTVTLVKRKKA
jgi:hypothetical protein